MARITTVNEIKNIVALGLDVWVSPPVGEISSAWCMKNLRLTHGRYGLMLSSPTVIPDYLPKWGIYDPNCQAVMYIYNGNESRLYNTRAEAQQASDQRIVDVRLGR